MATSTPRSKLTASQQSHVRANMMRSAALIATQIHEYLEKGELTIAGNIVPVTSERLATWRLALSKTIPDLSATEITHKRELEDTDTLTLVKRLAELVKTRPELAQQLQNALPGRLIEAQPIENHDSTDTLENTG